MADIGVYKITNILNNRVYVGSSSHISHRIYCHKQDLKNNKHHSLLLQRSWNKYGEESFLFEIIEVPELNQLIEREQYWIDFYCAAVPETGFNRSPTAGTTAGCVKSDITRKRISDSKKGSIPWNKGLKGVQKWAKNDPKFALAKARKGIKRAAYIGKKISATKKARGQKPSKKAINMSAEVRRGKKNPAVTNKLKLLWADPEWRADTIAKQKAGRLAKKDKQV